MSEREDFDESLEYAHYKLSDNYIFDFESSE